MTDLFLPEKNAELTRSAACPRGEPAREAVPHLPGAVLNEVTECGWPAQPARVTRYQLTVAISNHEQNRKLELFPARYDNRPLYARALERRVSR